MKIMNFSVVEILPSLLDKSKTQTIRPAWHDRLVYIKDHKAEEKPPRFKVGESVKLLWKQGSKFDLFCEKCGEGKKHQCISPVSGSNDGTYIRRKERIEKKYFHKHLGTVEITEVFKIEMMKSVSNKSLTKYLIVRVPKKKNSQVCIYPEGINLHYPIKSNLLNGEETQDLAKRDGFKDGVIPLKGGVAGKYSVETAAEQMFKYFDKAYDLSSPKEFHVYRWKWIK